MNLPLKQKLKLIRQRIYASVGFRGHKPVGVFDHELGARIESENKSIIVPSPLRWKLYKKGWAARIEQLKREYGVGAHVKLRPGDTILDIGANAGEFAYVADEYGAKIFCVEPDPNVFACLQTNTAGLPDVYATETLIWKDETELDFYSVPQSADSSVFAGGKGPALKKHATTVENFCKAQNIEHVNLLKCDAEGAEPEVLMGVGTMWGRIDVFALDTGRERKGKRTNEECKALLADNGYDVIDEKFGKRLMTFGIRRG
ncbi:MAG: FkbM family methyltransferase [Marinicaulis sp.]|nr:FkbM family methyltransferase [Marinicaulis sp.]